MDNFGSPQLDDPTAAWEQDMEFVAQRVREFFENDAPRVINRPPGTTKIPSESEKQEWLMTVADPMAVQQRRDALAAVVGLEQANYEIVTWDAKMQKKYKG